VKRVPLYSLRDGSTTNKSSITNKSIPSNVALKEIDTGILNDIDLRQKEREYMTKTLIIPDIKSKSSQQGQDSLLNSSNPLNTSGTVKSTEYRKSQYSAAKSKSVRSNVSTSSRFSQDSINSYKLAGRSGVN